LEWSFSEGDPDALRIELQPFDPVLSGEKRFYATLRALSSLIEAHHDKELANQFSSAAQLSVSSLSKLTFGAFLGLVHRPFQNHEYKIYVECGPDQPFMITHDLSTVTGIVPHFVSVSVSGRNISERVYYICRDGLRILDLEAVCAALGLSYRFPAMLMRILELTEGKFYLPPTSVLLGIRRQREESELKVELICDTAMRLDGLIARIERSLQPGNVAAFRRWLAVIHQGNARPLRVNVVSVKSSTLHSERLTVYAADPCG